MDVGLEFIYGFPVSRKELQMLLANSPFSRWKGAQFDDTFEYYNPGLDIEFGRILHRLEKKYFPSLSASLDVFVSFCRTVGTNHCTNEYFIGVAGDSAAYGTMVHEQPTPANFDLASIQRSFSLESQAAVAEVKQILGLSGKVGNYLLVQADSNKAYANPANDPDA